MCLKCSLQLAKDELARLEKEHTWAIAKAAFSGFFILVALLVYVGADDPSAGFNAWVIAGVAGIPAAFKASRRSEKEKMMDEIHDQLQNDIINLLSGWMIRLFVRIAIIVLLAPICAAWPCLSSLLVLKNSAANIKNGQKKVQTIEELVAAGPVA